MDELRARLENIASFVGNTTTADALQLAAYIYFVMTFCGYIISYVVLSGTGVEPLEVMAVLDFTMSGARPEIIPPIIYSIFFMYQFHIDEIRIKGVKQLLTIISVIALASFAIWSFLFSLYYINSTQIGFWRILSEFIKTSEGAAYAILIMNIPVTAFVLFRMIVGPDVSITQNTIAFMFGIFAIVFAINIGLQDKQNHVQRPMDMIENFIFSSDDDSRESYSTLRFSVLISSSANLVFKDRLTGEISVVPRGRLQRTHVTRRLPRYDQ